MIMCNGFGEYDLLYSLSSPHVFLDADIILSGRPHRRKIRMDRRVENELESTVVILA
jgi:hypothetical protein